MKPADVHCQCGCGRVVLQPRGGGPRKRFFENACRARWARKGKQKKAGGQSAVQGLDDRQVTLERIYEELKADLAERGSMIGGRLNPAVDMIRKIIGELDRRSALSERGEAEEIASLHAI